MSATGKLMSWFQGRKDTSVSFVLEKMLQKQIAPYGRLIEFNINSRQNTACVEVLLRGEAEPVTIRVEEYHLSQDNQTTYLTVERASASREWLGLLLNDFVLGKRFAIPDKYSKYAKMVL